MHLPRRTPCISSMQEVSMSLTMILVIVLIVLALGGGGYYWRR